MAYAMIGYNARPKKEYISTAPFNYAFYGYTLTPATLASPITTGSLALLSGLDMTNCPAGRILREVGRKLYPGVDPGLQSGDANYVSGYNHIWTKVYDAITGFSGYIDTNATIFAPYANNPVEFVDDGETDGSHSRLGAPVYTGGDVIAVGNIVAGGNITASGTIISGTSISAGTYLAGHVIPMSVYNTGLIGTAWTNTANSPCDVFINPTRGNVFILDLTGSGYTGLNGTSGNLNNINIYCASGGTALPTPRAVSVIPPAGMTLTLIVKAPTYSYPPVLVGAGIKMTNLQLVSAKTVTATFVSDGVSLIQTGSSANIPL